MPDRYTDADPLRLGLGDVPVTIVQGTDDEQVPVEMNRLVAADHPGITYVELEGVDHFALIDPLSPAFRDHVLPTLRGD
jgi:pimeloyl-ACP methyl ester carboxylesterase